MSNEQCYSVTMLCSSSTTTTDSPFSATSHIPVTGGNPGACEAGLWQRRTRWPPGLPHAPFAIGTEFSGTADLSHEILGPHHRRACHSSLAARTREDHVQDRRAVVQSPPRKCAPVSGTPRACARSARSTDAGCVLRIPVGFSYHPSSCQQSAAEPSRLPVPAPGTPCRKKSRRHRHR